MEEMLVSYVPDRWTRIKLNVRREDGTYDEQHRVLAAWKGGWLHSDSWRLSSPIKDVIQEDAMQEVYTEGGSIYECYKDRQGHNPMIESKLSKLREEFGEDNVEVLE